MDDAERRTPILDFEGLAHPSDLCRYYSDGVVVAAEVRDEFSFLDAMVNATVNCVLFAEDVVVRSETFAPRVRTTHHLPAALSVHTGG